MTRTDYEPTLASPEFSGTTDAGWPRAERGFGMLFEHMLNGVAYCKIVLSGDLPIDFIYLYTNPAFQQQTGLVDVVGRKVSEIVPGLLESDRSLLELYGRVALTAEPQKFEIYVEAMKQWFSVSAYCPQHEHFVSVFEDITERRQKEQKLQEAESRLRESESSFRSMFDNNDAIMLMLDADNGRIIDANASALRFYGYDVEHIKAMSIRDINAADEYEISQAMARARTHNHNFFVFKHRLASRETRTVEVRSSPFLLDGRTVLFSIISDVSDRQKAEELLRNSEERLQRAELASKTGNWELYLDTKEVAASAGAEVIYGVGKGRFELASIQGMVLPEFRPMLDAALADLIESDALYDVEFKIRLNAGYIKDIRSRATFDRKRRILFGVVQDITEQKSDEEALRLSEERYRLLAENSDDVIWTLSLPNGKFTYISPSVEHLRGYTAEEVMAQPMEQALTAESAMTVKTTMSDMLSKIAAGERINLTNVTEVDQPHRDGHIVHTEVVTRYILDAAGNPISVMGVTRDITQRKHAEIELERLAHTDSLTSLNNRRNFMALATQELARTQRYGGDFSVLMMDIDHFKRVNDTHGHHVGDIALQKVAEVFREGLRDIDCIGRIGGEEFAAVLPQTDVERAIEVAERLRQCVQTKEIPFAGGTFFLTLSVGVTTLARGNGTLDELLAQADSALYEAKHLGRNRTSVFDYLPTNQQTSSTYLGRP